MMGIGIDMGGERMKEKIAKKEKIVEIRFALKPVLVPPFAPSPFVVMMSIVLRLIIGMGMGIVIMTKMKIIMMMTIMTTTMIMITTTMIITMLGLRKIIWKIMNFMMDMNLVLSVMPETIIPWRVFNASNQLHVTAMMMVDWGEIPSHGPVWERRRMMIMNLG